MLKSTVFILVNTYMHDTIVVIIIICSLTYIHDVPSAVDIVGCKLTWM